MMHDIGADTIGRVTRALTVVVGPPGGVRQARYNVGDYSRLARPGKVALVPFGAAALTLPIDRERNPASPVDAVGSVGITPVECNLMYPLYRITKANAMRTCGDCHNHRPDTQECALSLSYAAFVRADAPANGCIGYIEKERAEAERQSECRPITLPALFQQWQQQVVKP